MPAGIKLTIYRVAQEALNNIMKHAQAKRIRVVCHCQQYEFHLIIEDDGCGFNPANVPTSHLGLQIMDERAEENGLKLSVESQIGQGTRIHLRGMFGAE